MHMESPFTELERALFGLHPGRRSARQREDVAPPASLTRLDAWDTGPAIVLRVQVPGLSERDIQLTFEGDVLTLRGERKADLPEGYTAVQRQRGAQQYYRSIRLGVKLDV